MIEEFKRTSYVNGIASIRTNADRLAPQRIESFGETMLRI
jgi:hypothetical protein